MGSHWQSSCARKLCTGIASQSTRTYVLEERNLASKVLELEFNGSAFLSFPLFLLELVAQLAAGQTTTCEPAGTVALSRQDLESQECPIGTIQGACRQNILCRYRTFRFARVRAGIATADMDYSTLESHL